MYAGTDDASKRRTDADVCSRMLTLAGAQWINAGTDDASRPTKLHGRKMMRDFTDTHTHHHTHTHHPTPSRTPPLTLSVVSPNDN
jgi:hypothetical protein